MASPKKNRKPSFFWQGMLILCPVVIMGVVAISAVVSDRSIAEREAHQRAADLLNQLSRDFEGKFDQHRSDYEVFTSYFGPRELDRKLLPTGISPGDLRANAPRASALLVQDSIPDKLAANLPASLLATEGAHFCPAFNTDGGMYPLLAGVWQISMPPGNEPPIPPKWREQLTPEQQAAWETLCRAAMASNNLPAVRAALQKFKDTRPGEGAMQNALFLEQRSVLETDPSPTTAQAMLNIRQDVSETGIPLSTLGLVEALKRIDQFTDVRGLWDKLVSDAYFKPNFLTPALIKLAEPLAQRNPPYQECLTALKARWLMLEDMWGIGEEIQRGGKLNWVAKTNLWLEYNGQPWFCVLEPDTNRWDDGKGTITTNLFTKSRLFSLAAVTWAIKQAVEEARVTVPPYFALSAQLGDSHSVTIFPGNFGALRDPGPVIAQVRGHDDNLAGSEYVLRIHLADAALMLATQRQRAVMICGLVAISALAALVGFFAAQRAFYRQLRLNEMKSNFVSSVSHELRAPIASVRLMAEGLERGKISGAEKQHEYFRFIVQECRRLSSLIENVLDFSRIEQGRKQYELESTDLAALATETVKLMQTYAAEQDIRISFATKGEPIPVEIDGKAMQQALINLIDNAIKHSPKGSESKVGLDCKSGCVELWVEDNGEGIPAAEHEKIFERFYRIGSEMRRQTQGVGIGLSIVKHIVEAHGGTIVVRSAVGEGSRFTIVLPATNGVRPK